MEKEIDIFIFDGFKLKKKKVYIIKLKIKEFFMEDFIFLDF